MFGNATLSEYADIKEIDLATLSPTERRVLVAYLRRGTQTIEGITRRRFLPFEEYRRYSIPSNYVDLRQRAFIRDDLPLDKDLLEVIRVQLGINNSVVEMSEVVPGGGLTARQETFIAGDVDGLDQVGNRRISVGDILRIEFEDCPVVRVNDSTNEVQIRRGAFDTAPVPHAAGADVQKISLTTLQPGIEYHLLDFNIRPAIAIRIVWPATWAGRFTGSSWRFRYPQIYIDGVWGYNEHKDEWWVDTLASVPSGGFDHTTTPIALEIDSDATDENGDLVWQEGYLYRIDTEMFWGGTVVEGATGSIQLLRGRHGTAALDHAEGTPIERFQVQRDVVEATIDIARTLRESDSSVGGRQGVSDMSVGVPIGFGVDTQRTVKRLVRSLV